MIDAFLHHQEHYKGTSHDRCVRQARLLREFQASLGGRPLIEANAPDLYDFMAGKIDQGLHPNTVRQYRNMIRPFFTWAWRRGEVDADRFLRLRDVECPQGATANSKPNPYSRRELQQFWADLDRVYPLLPEEVIERWRKGRIKRWRRIRRHALRLEVEAIISLALEMGLRRSEIRCLDLDQLHYDNEYIAVVGKGAKEREVPYTPGAREAVRAWLEFRTLMAPEHDAPWLSCYYAATARNPMYAERFNMLVQTVGPYRLHRFRHTCATERLRAGMPLETVRDLLGHATLRQTLSYAEIARHDLSRALERSNGAFAAAVRPRALREAA